MLLKVERRTIGLRKEGGIDSTFVAILQTGRGKKIGNFSGVNGVGYSGSLNCVHILLRASRAIGTKKIMSSLCLSLGLAT